MLKNLGIEVKGLGKTILLSLLLSVLLASIIYFTGLKETLIAPLSKLVLIASIFTGGCYVSKKYGSKGLVRGASLGLMFFTLILIASLIFDPTLISFKDFMYMLAICLGSGAAGGILGIGLSDSI